jgi:DNA repair exonuclease SbcCD ATPase subunit
MSGLLQLAGISTVFLSLRHIRKKLGLPDILDEIWADVSARIDTLFQKPKTYTLKLSVDDLTVKAFAPTVTLHLSPDAAIERRVEHLESQLERLIHELAESERKREEDWSQIEAEIAKLNATTTKSIEKLSGKLHNLAGSGMRLEVIGLMWLAVGALLPSFGNVAFILWPSP